MKAACRVPILLLVIMLAGACASKRFVSTIAPPPDTSTWSMRFRIADTSPPPPEAFYITGYTDNAYWTGRVKDTALLSEFTAQLQDVACQMYPDLFSDSADALPLQVDITAGPLRDTSLESSLMAALSWGIFGLVLPLPIGMKCDFGVAVACPEADLDHQSQFENHLSSWISCPSPLALVPVPVPGRVARRASVLYPRQSKYYSGRLFSLECFVAAIVQALDQADQDCLEAAYLRRVTSLATWQPTAHRAAPQG